MYLLLSPSCSVMFRLNCMLFLQPLLEPNGEKGSENHTHTALLYPAELFVVSHLPSHRKGYPLTSGGLYEILCVFPLLQHQTQSCLTDCCLRRGSQSGEEFSIVLRNEAGAHVSSLKLRVTRKAQQKVYVSVQSHNLRTKAKKRVKKYATKVNTEPWILIIFYPI